MSVRDTVAEGAPPDDTAGAASDEPGTGPRATGQPTTDEPDTGQQATGQPATDDPGTGIGTGQAATDDPGTGQATTGAPTHKGAAGHPNHDGVELIESRTTEVGGLPVRRALPRRPHRTIGAWCFLDHFGPSDPLETVGMRIGPHPHIGLHTVTWLRHGEVLHTDSLGTEQVIRPGQLNLMSAGAGIAHAEASTARHPGGTHGAQLWVAMPEATRNGPPAFEHHAELPQVELGAATATVLVGSLLDAHSPARADTPLVGAEIDARTGATTLPLDPTFEHGLVVLDGAVEVAGHSVTPGHLAYLPTGRTEVELRATEPARVLLVGGTPYDEPIVMWWNFVAQGWDEVASARADWEAATGRFGEVRSDDDVIPAPPPTWPPGTAAS